jgi:hypothetical protein
MLGQYQKNKVMPANGQPMTNSRLIKLSKLWHQQKGDRLLPAKTDFTAQLLKPWLGHIGLVDVSYDPLRFCVRRCGEVLVRYAGGDYTGQWIHECVAPENLDSVLRPYRDCVEHGEPVYNNTVYVHPGASRALLQRLYMPCSSDGIVIDTVMVAIYALQEFGRYYS